MPRACTICTHAECEALLETMQARNEAAARLRRNADPDRREG